MGYMENTFMALCKTGFPMVYSDEIRLRTEEFRNNFVHLENEFF